MRGLGQVPEAVLAEVSQLDAVRQGAGRECPRRVRKQDLPAVTGRRDARDLVERQANVVAAHERYVARVDAHADSDRAALGPGMRRERTLRLDGCGDG